MANPLITNTDVYPIELGNNLYKEVTIAAGEVVLAGEVLGVITSSGTEAKYATCDSVKVDGAQYARAIAHVAVDATAGDTLTQVTIAGDLDSSKLVFSNVGDTLLTVPAGTTDNYELQLRDFSMYANLYEDVYGLDNQ